ncbi:MarR family transcriptional regulator [Pseudonocardia benzenivorans]|uniref:MarR family transcriptional regulator n=1 Tax=Pseudonocardia benzenivorans TaxID=228005 RepID=A0ABW3VJU0_9PSEU
MTALASDKTDYDVLNTVALKKMATPQVVAEACGLPRTEVEAALDRLAAQGLLVVAGGAALPTDEAEPALAAAAARRYGAVRADAEVGGLVERFETVNSQFLTTMSSWQQVDVGGRKVANDHSDAEYDDKVIARLDKLIARLSPLLEALAGHDARFGTYPARFRSALERIDRGEHEYVSSPTLDSVHNVWFEFHEDLLRTLGRERTE